MESSFNHEGPYVCECGATFEKQVQLTSHKSRCKIYRESVGLPTTFICEFCGKECKDSSSLSRHINKEHLGKQFKQKSKSICPVCGKLIQNSNLQRHILSHERKINNKIHQCYHLDHADLFCKFCGKECKNKNSLVQHEIRCKQNPDMIASSLKNQGWSKGLTKCSDDRILHNSITKKEYYKTHIGTFKGKKHKQISKEKMSIAHSLIDHANTNHNSHGKRGYKYGIFFMSSYELAYYLFNKITQPEISIKRCKKRYEYIFEGKKHTYTPDFILNDSQIIEVKGWETPLDKFKYTLVEGIIVLRQKDIQPMIDYVKDYFKVTDLSQLYDQ